MKKFLISKSRRLRSTPFTSRLEKYGIGAYTVYNHMLLPTFFSSPEEEYSHLKEHVQIWDVSVQREIEISGKDSSELVQLMTCRDLSNSKIGGCYYAPLVDSEGGLVNDPLIYRLEEKRWRVCIADSDVLLFAKGISAAKNLEVDIFEAKIDTLAIQGPKSFELMKKVFGEKINNLKFFKFDFFNWSFNFITSSFGESWSITIISNSISEKNFLEKFKEEIIEFKERKVYSDLFFSNNLFLLWVSMFILVHDLNITVR